MARFGFNSGSYASQSLSADAQLTQNWYPESDGSAQGKSAIVLYPEPGLSLFSALADMPVRGVWKVQTPGVAERVFAIAGSTLFEIFSDGTSVNRGTVNNDGRPASMANSNIQLMIASGGKGYCLTLATNVLTGPIANIAGVVKVGYSDGYFVAWLGQSARFQISGLLDGTTWDLAQSAIVSVFPDNALDMLVDHRFICILGEKQSVCYYDSGNTFPYDVIEGSFVEQGTVGSFCNVKVDNTIYGIWKDERGSGVAYKAQGYTPVRISTHAIEYAWQGYSRIDDAEAYPYQDQGHSFVVWYFPTANKTWVYDIATGLWHQRAFGESDTETAHRSRCHVFAFGKHLVGDWATGNIYQMAIPVSNGTGGWNFVTDFGNAIRRVRRSPYVGVPELWNYLNKLEFEIQSGLGPSPPLLSAGAYNSSNMTSSGGSTALKYEVIVGGHGTTPGDQYTASGTFKNNGTTAVTISLSIGAATSSQTLQPGTAAAVSLGPVTSDGSQVLFDISTAAAGNILDLTGCSPTLIDITSDPTLNLLTGDDLIFAQTGAWAAQGGATVTVTQGNPYPLSSPVAPKFMLRYSKDGGQTWSTERQLSAGFSGNTSLRMIARRLGRVWGTRGIVFELSTSDPIPWRVVDAYLEGPNMIAQERLPHQIRKQA